MLLFSEWIRGFDESNFFVGEIPQELGNLVELERLILLDNVHLTGHIPSLLFNISTLWQINLTNNSLTGDLPHNMCSHHHQAAVLKILQLSVNQITGTIPYNLWHCRELAIVSLSYNKFRGERKLLFKHIYHSTTS